MDYLTQRTELLVGVFYLLTLYCSIRSWESAGGRRWTAGAVACCALGMCSKEVMVSAPLAVLLYDRAFVSGSLGGAIRRHGTLYLGLAATWLLLIGLMVSSPRGAAVGFHLGISARDYLMTQAGAIVHYLRLSIWPHPLVLSYDDWPIAHTFAEVAPQALFILLLLGVTLVSLLRNSWLGFVGAWFFMILAPSSSFVPIVTEVVVERRMYLPLAAVVVVVILGSYSLLARLARAHVVLDRAAHAAVVVVIVALAVMTIRRNQLYRSAVAIWQDNVAHRPADALAHTQLGAALFRQGDLAAATTELREAVRLKPDYALAHIDLGASLLRQGDFEGAEKELLAALAIHPDSGPAHQNLAVALMKQGRTDEGIAHFQEAARLAPQSADARVSLGAALIAAKRFEEGIEALKESLRLRPDAKVHACLADLLRDRGRLDEAALHSREAQRLQH